jgi:O-antigen/teichoic acid export membrane protein
MPARYSWLTTVIALGTMFVAIPRFGLLGAAWAMLLGYATSLIFAANARKKLRIAPAQGRRRFWFGLVLGCAVQAALIAALRATVTGWMTLLSLGVLAWASFYLTRMAMNALTPEEAGLIGRVRQLVSSRSAEGDGGG